MRYRDLSLEEFVTLEHSIRLHRHALLKHSPLITEAMRSINSTAGRRLRRVEGELILLAGDIEGRSIQVYGPEVFNRMEREHLADCAMWKATTPWPVPVCPVSD